MVEPFLGIILDLRAQANSFDAPNPFPKLIQADEKFNWGLCFSSLEHHDLPALSDRFFRKDKKNWLASFIEHLKQYEVNKLENAL